MLGEEAKGQEEKKMSPPRSSLQEDALTPLTFSKSPRGELIPEFQKSNIQWLIVPYSHPISISQGDLGMSRDRKTLGT